MTTIAGMTIESAITVEDTEALDLLPIGIVLVDEDGDEWRKEAHDIFSHLGNQNDGEDFDYGIFHTVELMGGDDHGDGNPLVILNPELLDISVADGASAAAV